MPLRTEPVFCKLADHFLHVSRVCNANQGREIVMLLSLQVQKAENLLMLPFNLQGMDVAVQI